MQAERWTSRQIGRLTNRQADKRPARPSQRQVDRQVVWQTVDKNTIEKANRKVSIQTSRKSEIDTELIIQTGSQIDRHAVRQAGRY